MTVVSRRVTVTQFIDSSTKLIAKYSVTISVIQPLKVEKKNWHRCQMCSDLDFWGQLTLALSQRDRRG
jgi:hypothetical protein